MWIKYVHTWAYGHGSDWMYIELPDICDPNDNQLEDCIHEIEQDWNWSDKYRGIKYEIIEHPPIEYLQSKIKSLQHTINSSQKSIEQYMDLITKIGLPSETNDG